MISLFPAPIHKYFFALPSFIQTDSANFSFSVREPNMLIEYFYQHTGLYLLFSRLFSTSVATVVAFLLAMLLFPFVNSVT